jgi:excisionase family DNA binding protein
MSLSIKEAARLLGVSENRVRSDIASGKLSVERKGRQILIPEAELEALAEAEKGSAGGEHEAGLEPQRVLSASPMMAAIELINSRLGALENQLIEKWQMVVEHQRLQQLLRDLDRQLAEKDRELEKLRRDLVYQKRLGDKELEDQRRTFEERLVLMERGTALRPAQEQERIEQALAREWQVWSEKLALEQERFAHTLASMRSQEGFWARLARMITWS